MAKNNFLMLDLNDKKAKKVANVVGNETCKKILNILSEDNATESEIAHQLDIPISTVHYNLQQLMDAGLVVTDEYHYSEKGKEVNHYKLANKYIIITPKKVHGIRRKLRAILPAAGISLLAAAVVQFSQIFFQAKQGVIQNAPKAMLATENVVGGSARAVPKAADAMLASAPQGANATVNTLAAHAPAASQLAANSTGIFQNLALWFLLGAFFALVIYALIGMIRKD